MSVIPKVFEALITTKFSGLMNNCLSNNEHGFRSKHFIIINNLIFQSDILDCIGEGKQLDCIYTDFKKVVDKVNHKLLLFKLSCYGIHGIFLKWIESYLYGRIQQVKLSNTI